MGVMRTVATRILKPLTLVLAERGVDVSRLLAAAGIASDRTQSRLPADALSRACTLAVERSADPGICLHAGMSSSPATLGVLGYVLQNAATIGQAWAQLQRYWQLVDDDALFDIARKRGQATIRMRRDATVDPADAQPLIEYLLGMLLRLSGSLAGGELRGSGHLRAIDFRHGPPTAELATLYTRHFAPATLQFSQPHNALHFAAALLDHPVAAADPALYDLLTRQADAELAALGTGRTVPERVRVSIQRSLPGTPPSLTQLARTLCMSRATLQRRLAEADTGYQALVDEARQARADTMLADPSISIGEVAFALGYGDTAAFHHAYKRWTGHTPAQARRSVS